MSDSDNRNDDGNGYRDYCEPAILNGQTVMIAAYSQHNPVMLVFDRYGHVFLWLTAKYTIQQLGEVLAAIGETDVWTTEDPFLDEQPELEDFDLLRPRSIVEAFVLPEELLAIDAVKLRNIAHQLEEQYEVEG